MALQLDLGKRELWFLKLLAKGQVEFEEMPFERKLLVYEANVDITDVVDQDQIREFEEELAMKNYFGPTEMAKAAAKRTKRKLV